MSSKASFAFDSKKLRTIVWSFLVFISVQCAWAGIEFPVKSAGKATTSKQGVNAFSQPSANLSFEKRLDFSVGNSFFRNPWVTAPASTTARDGLGPLFNTNGCQNCHIKDGRGHLPQTAKDNAVSVLVRVGLEPITDADWQHIRRHGAIADPSYGTQIQDFAIPGVKPEAKVTIEYESHQVILADGESVELVKPNVVLQGLKYGPLHERAKLSLRLAPPMIGLGLLEAIPDNTLQSFADPNDENNDGISGRINLVYDVESQTMRIGRFGWKAEQPSLKQQNAAAFLGDLGITSELFSQENCQPHQSQCANAPSGGNPELSANILNKVTFYSRNLAVPKRRNVNQPDVQRGAELFVDVGCHQCHRTGMVTAKIDQQPEQSEIAIYPYTDMLLHDMGEGLADHRPVFQASGSEWRTAPLWGIGLTRQVSGSEHYLHDGRARTLLEAILWHGGEAQASRQKVVKMTAEQRNDLVAFLQSL